MHINMNKHSSDDIHIYYIYIKQIVWQTNYIVTFTKLGMYVLFYYILLCIGIISIIWLRFIVIMYTRCVLRIVFGPHLLKLRLIRTTPVY